ncbi:hypothetical protein HK105_206274 [Polyrhizophydium stewartii]|uniref:UspA domain-containing protein n=1 Tax=Polyrhizophydium stewartii TaxID=2732419 RepID=A0ABR4N3R5_9FUNG|nr:hypothetical protein HK105_002668 [Polyrhizophydium stewartii]
MTNEAAPEITPVPHEPKTIHEEVHMHDHFEPTRIVCIAVDSSKNSEYAVSWAVKNVLKAETDQVVLLNVRPYVYVPLYASHYLAEYPTFNSSDAFAQLEEANKQASHELLIQVAKTLQNHGIHTRAIALRGDAREELLFKIEDVKADLVIMGSRGLGAVRRAFIGSVSDYLVHNTKIPTIVTRMPEV